MKTPGEGQSSKPDIKSREQAEQAGFSVVGDAFDPSAREVLESFLKDLIEGQIIIVQDGAYLRLAVCGTNQLAVSALLIRVRMRVKRAAKETERLPLQPDSRQTPKVTDTTQEVRDSATKAFKWSDPPQQ